MDLKNNKLVNKYFSDLVERTSAPPMEIIADGTQANENPAASYRGFGCVTGNNSSRLLLDYKVEHPHAYEEIMRLLFEKNYGAGLRSNWARILTLLPELNHAANVLQMNRQM